MSLPLVLPPYFLDSTAFVQTTIVSNYYTASVSFYNAGQVYYTATLLKQAPTVTLPPDLAVGNFVIQSGTLTMQIPSSTQPGSVTLNCKFTDPEVTQSEQMNAMIASWNLNQ